MTLQSMGKTPAVLVSFNNWDSITFSNKAIPSEAFEEFHRVVLDGTSDSMTALVQYGKYGTMNTTYSTTMGCYVIKFYHNPTLYREILHVIGKSVLLETWF